MPGYDTDTVGGGGTVFATNVDFTGNSVTAGSPQMVSNGQLLIGSAATPRIKVGTLTSPLGTITIGYSSPNITLDLSGGAAAIERVALQTGITPIVPLAGQITFNGSRVAAGTNPVRTNGTSANTMQLEVQISQAIAATDATKIGLAAFSNTDFSVDANGFVSIISSGFTWTDVTTATQNLAAENGYLTDRGGGVVYTLPATASIGDTIKIVGKLGIATITPNANQQILFSSASGTVGATGTAVATNVGDCVELVCTTSGASSIWRAANFVGNWTLN